VNVNVTNQSCQVWTNSTFLRANSNLSVATAYHPKVKILFFRVDISISTLVWKIYTKS
jgi:hypothetical protein